MSDYARRLRTLEVIYQAEARLPVQFLLGALPPMSAAVAAQWDAWCAEGEAVVDDDEPSDPDEHFRAQGFSDIDMAEYVLRTVPHDMVISAHACASLLVCAYFDWDKERYGEAYAWHHWRKHGEFLPELERRFSAL